MSDNNFAYKFSRVSFGLDNAHALKDLLKEFNTNPAAQSELGTKKNRATSLLMEINNALLDDPSLGSGFLKDTEFLLILINAQRFSNVDREFCGQCFLFFNLIKQNEEDSNLMLQSLPLFLSHIERFLDMDVFSGILKMLKTNNPQNFELFLQVVVRNQAFLKYVDEILKTGENGSVDLLNFLIVIIPLPNVEIVLRTLAPTIFRLADNRNFEGSNLAKKLGKVLKTTEEQEEIKRKEREKEEEVRKQKIKDNEKMKKLIEAEENKSLIGCICGCGEMSGGCINQREILPGTCFVAPEMPDSSSIAIGTFGRVTGQFGFLYINKTISTGIWQCTIKFCENKGFCRVGIAECNASNTIGNLDGEGSLAYDNMGNYVQPGSDTVASKRGWKKDALITLEIDTNKRQLCTYVADKLQFIVFTNIPKIVRVYTWNVNPSLVQIIKFFQVPTSAERTDQTRVFDWERKS